MNRHSRLTAVLDTITDSGYVDVAELAKRLQVSPSTIRRDLTQLSQQNLLARTHGGAVPTSVNYDLPVRYRRASSGEEKVRIGRAVAALVPDGAVVGLTGGTTTTEAARSLAERAPATDPAFTIVTNAINIASELTVRRHLKLVMTGGVARMHSFELTGPLAYDTLAQIDLDVAILGVNALDPTWGAKVADEDEAQINRLMAERARTTIIVADSSKLSARAFVRVCPLGEIDVLVTDAGAGADDVARIREAGVRVVVA
ncbi:DeoR/GlpR family DNA-binding transcription regulator [Nocardioides panacihumi]|uniref:DeoR/GlpR family DNA-binding transcription regulator n=1 Tax=Nocardioides panacihumi TaxID=400774 RepID=A0ABN2RKV8_9ACTN